MPRLRWPDALRPESEPASRSLIDEIAAMMDECLQRLAGGVNWQDRDGVTVNRGPEDRFPIMIVGLEVGVQRLAIVLRGKGMNRSRIAPQTPSHFDRRNRVGELVELQWVLHPGNHDLERAAG